MVCAKRYLLDEKDEIIYGSELLNIYDSLLEINLKTGVVNAIFYDNTSKETKYSFDLKELRTDLARTIHNRDRRKFIRAFSDSSLRAIINNKCSKRMEFRIRCNEGVIKKIKMCLTPYCCEENNTVLCYNYIVKSDIKNERLRKIDSDFNELLKKAYRSIYIIDIKTGYAVIFKDTENHESEGDLFNWDNFISNYSKNLIYGNDKKIVQDNFSISGLTNIFKSERDEFKIDIKRKSSCSGYVWVEIGIRFGISDGNIKVYFTERDSDELHLLQAIVDKFVYNSCDYFIYLDIKNNSYTMFSYSDRITQHLPAKSNDYLGDIKSHIERYVVNEEQEEVTENFSLSTISKNLDLLDEYVFTYGIIDVGGEYRRKLVKYVYYDRINEIVLLIRNDITQQYLEQMNKSISLQFALESAERDSLTKLYNKQAVKDRINKKLNDANGRLSATLFLDLDDFKAINDNFGHPEGDAALKVVATALTKSIRSTDLVGRYGGDEFIIFISDIKSKGEVLRCVDRIFKCLDKTDNQQDNITQLKTFSCSVGIAFSPEDGESFDELVEKADLALYRAKRMGKNCCSIYNENT